MGLMFQQKTVTVKQIINYNLKPIEERNTKLFPVYTKVIYESTNTKFKTQVEGKGIYVDQDLEFSDSRFLKEKEKIEKQNSMIEKIVRYEISLLKDRFTLKGLSDKILVYQIPITDIFNDISRLVKLDEYLKGVLIYNDFISFQEIDDLIYKIRFLNEYKNDQKEKGLLKKIPKRISYPIFMAYLMVIYFRIIRKNTNVTIYDWIFGLEQQKFQEMGSKLFEYEAKEMELLEILMGRFEPFDLTAKAITDFLNILIMAHSR